MKYPEEMIIKARELHAAGLSVRGIERELAGPSRMTVWRWIAGAHDGPSARVKPTTRRRRMELPEVVGDGPIYPDVDPEDKDEVIRRLRLENDILRGMQEVLKAPALGCSTNREKALLIEWLRANTDRPLRELTASLRISKSSYEYQRKAIAAGDKYGWLRPLVAEEFWAEDGVRGYRVVTHRLRMREEPVVVSEKVVRRIMAEENLRVRRKREKRYSSYAGEAGERPENMPLREDGTHDFGAEKPNQKWVSDITEFRLPDDPRRAYLSPVLDLFDGKPVGWAISPHPDAALANGSLLAAGAQKRPWEHPFCHTDGGIHYFWPKWAEICEEHGVARSMSRKGCSPDNAACEGFFGILKNEFFYGRDWRGVTYEEFAARLDAWMRRCSTDRIKYFKEDGKTVYDTIDNRRKRLGFTA